MNRVSRLVLSFAVIGIAASSPAQEPVAKLYRVSSSNEVVITGISTDGLVTWSNEVLGTMARVEVADLNSTNDWHTYTHVISTGGIGTVRLWHDDTPDGFAFCPAGTFVMGSSTNELGRSDDETQHRVTLTRDFFLQKTEVTNRQLADALNWAQSHGKVSVTSATVINLEGNQQELLDLDGGLHQILWNGSQLVVDAGKDDYPCLEVTWYGSQAYCNYLSDMDGLSRAVEFDGWTVTVGANGYRLPTESEWEYACRAGTTAAFYTGRITYTESYPLDPNLNAAGWYDGNSANPENPIYRGAGSHQVGLKQPNRWGLFDMHGNVWEWCGDWYSASYPGTVTDPTGPTSSTSRVYRGGSWNSYAHYGRSASRNSYFPGYSPYILGFRPARSSVPATPVGMVLIPRGTNIGTDPDFGAYSLTVEPFYMDRYEVTLALWDEVKIWNGGNGYDLADVGSGKAADHPVHSVNWHDCIKWCNARSEKEGRRPVYYTDAGLMQVYKIGEVLEPYDDASADGYRLPTEVQWEYAARGGVSSQRFPWGEDTIQHARANYYSLSDYSYDTSPTRGNHPDWDDGVNPYTSPVGTFESGKNAYGLYDMAGNVYEWCYEWHPNIAGSRRVLRGGNWNSYADYCRVAPRGDRRHYRFDYIGFRTVLPPGQQ